MGQYGILGVLVVLLVFAKQGELVIPLFVFCSLVDNDRIIGLQQENSHYSLCFILPPSSTTISPYWVTPQHTNKTLSSDHQAPTYTLNPPMYRVTGTPLFLLSYPTPLLTASIKTHPFSPFPFSLHYCYRWETHRLNTRSNYRDCVLVGLPIWGIVSSKLPLPKSS